MSDRRFAREYFSLAGNRKIAALVRVNHENQRDFTFHELTYNYDERLMRPPCSVEDMRGSDGWMITLALAHTPERCSCFDQETT